MIAYGEDCRDWGGAFAVYRGMMDALPHCRIFNSPLAEGAIVGTAVGYALSGGRAMVELMYADFIGCADWPTVRATASRSTWRLVRGSVVATCCGPEVCQANMRRKVPEN